MDNVSVILPILKKIPLFAELNEEQHRAIIEHIVLQYFPANHVIFNKDDDGDALYIIKNGSVQIFLPNEDPDEEVEIKILSVANFFGEMALVSNDPRNASARVIEDSEIFMLSKPDFMQLLNTTPGMANLISRELIARLKENSRREG